MITSLFLALTLSLASGPNSPCPDSTGAWHTPVSIGTPATAVFTTTNPRLSVGLVAWGTALYSGATTGLSGNCLYVLPPFYQVQLFSPVFGMGQTSAMVPNDPNLVGERFGAQFAILWPQTHEWRLDSVNYFQITQGQ